MDTYSNGLLAQNISIGGKNIVGPIPSSVGINSIGDLVNRVVQFLIPLAAIILLFVFISAGYDYMTSQGNAEKVKSAQAKLTTGLLGFFLLMLAYVLTKLIAFIFGLGEGII